MYVPAGWSEDTEKCKMKRVKDNVWKITLSPTIRDWFGSGSTPIEQLGLIIRSSDGKKGINADTFVEIQDDKYNGFVAEDAEIKSMPSGLQYGINVVDNSTVALVLYEAQKAVTSVIMIMHTLWVILIIGNVPMMRAQRCIMTKRLNVGGLC